MAKNFYARMEIDGVKSIAMRPVEDAYELRLLENGRSLSGVIPLSAEELNHIGQFGYKLVRGNIQICLEMGIYRLFWKKKEWALIKAGSWWELPRLCDSIREGNTTFKKEIWERSRVRMVGVDARKDAQKTS